MHHGPKQIQHGFKEEGVECIVDQNRLNFLTSLDVDGKAIQFF